MASTSTSASSVASAAPEPSARPRRALTMSIDTGGTFTDGFVSDGSRTAQVKVDTTPQDLTIGFQACLEAAAAAIGRDMAGFLGALTRLHFSSTIATNTIVERRGASLGLIVTRGAETELYGSATQVQALGSLLDLELVRGVTEEVDDRGAVVTVPSEPELEAAVRELLERGVRLLVLSFANAHLNPANELRARELIDRSYPRHYLGAVPLMVASRVSLAGDDHGRTAAAVVNAYLHPNLVRALYLAEDRARSRGLTHPLLIVNTDGSTSRVAKTRAIDTYDSGPTAGVLGASYVARVLGAQHVCTLDVGGTTTDVSFVADGRVPVSDVTDVGELVIPHPSVPLHSFGIGGGSIIAVEDTGEIRVGPRSAGASPGPACFGLGGEWLTPTDVWLLLGYLEPGEFLGGRRRLDPEPARAAAQAMAERRATTVERTLLEAKAAIFRELSRYLGAWAARQPALQASDPSTRWLFSYGGGGGLLSVEAAEILGIDRVVVFPHSSVFSAFGAGLLPIAHAYQAVVPAGSGEAALGAAVARLADNARRDLRAEGVHTLDEVQASLEVGSVSRAGLTLAGVLSAPDATAALGGAASVTHRIALHVSVPREAPVEMITAGADGEAARSREIVTSQGRLTALVAPGLGDPGASPVTGPAFLRAPDTTIFVPPGWSVTFTPEGYGILSREGSA
ncbi:MAG TPA: hydantoinase/oxoprolinase family protein [Solirubrobacteraceae bacterium]|nr:hydantoinase/oxoprolinase family protein [Solirubrobacteraceae bacterium]